MKDVLHGELYPALPVTHKILCFWSSHLSVPILFSKVGLLSFSTLCPQWYMKVRILLVVQYCHFFLVKSNTYEERHISVFSIIYIFYARFYQMKVVLVPHGLP